MAEQPLLSVIGLDKYFPLRRSLVAGFMGQPQHWVQAAQGVTFTVARGESFGLVGESGCGKTTLGRLVLGLLPVDDGAIRFDGQDVTKVDPATRRALRRQMQMVFQDPYSSLNPRMRIGRAIAEPLRLHGIVPADQVEHEVARLLERVGLPSSAAGRYPSELSGGQRQRVGIARALSVRPKLLVADEAVSGLDVSVRAQVLNLLDDLRRDLGLTLLFISHDLGVIEYLCETVGVMYLGTMVENGPTSQVFARPAHPYTRALLASIPRADPTLAQSDETPLAGEPPSPVNPPSGCPFRTRCPDAQGMCETSPPRVTLPGGRWAACHFAAETMNAQLQ
ncbi:ABC transporter ATP-binding protein [Acidisoma silvae]|nr:oligopeptide/dipeptide ABC transporter ATP-binding protein [Acidisoma silvae]